MKTLIVAFLSLTAFVACSTTPAPAEQPISNHFGNGIKYNIIAKGSGGYEYGVAFNVQKNGKISKLGATFPDPGAYRVTIWDATNKTVLAQTTINQTVAATPTWANIPALEVSTGKDYLVSAYTTGAWFESKPRGGGNIAYPIAAGNVSITGYQWIGSATGTPQVFPTNVDKTYYAGLAEFEFQPN